MPCDTNYYHTCCGALADDILSQKLKPAGHPKPPQATSDSLGQQAGQARLQAPGRRLKPAGQLITLMATQLQGVMKLPGGR
jgi:hypothetical protein